MTSPYPGLCPRRAALLAAALVCTIASQALHGQGTWTGGDGSWFEAGNWDTGVPASGTVSIHNGGTARIDGAAATAGNLLLGTAGSATGSGTLVLENGATLATTGGAILGQNANGGPALREGVLILDGNGSSWTNTGGTLYLGHSSGTGATGSGSVIVRNGAQLSLSGTSTLLGSAGTFYGSNATRAALTVTGAGSLFTSDGSFNLGYGGPAGITVAEGGTLALTGSDRVIRIADRSGSHVSINIGAAAGESAVAAGILNVAEINATAILGSFPLRNIVFNHTGSDHFFSSDGTAAGSAVKISGSNQVEVEAGTTTLLGSQTYTRRTNVNAGTLKLAGGGEISSTSALWVGNTGGKSGSLIVESGARVGSSGHRVLTRAGSAADANGTITVRGTGAELWAGTMTLGWGGSGTLNVEAGGAVYGDTTAELGSIAGSSGAATVTGTGSTWQISGLDQGLIVGQAATGSLEIAAGGSAGSGFGIVGNYQDADGEVEITGNGSVWSADAYFLIGADGTGTVNIGNGGRLSVFGNYIDGLALGAYATGEGTLRVSGAESLAEWKSNDFTVGKAGQGTLEISDGGKVAYTGANPFMEGEIHVASQAGSTGVIRLNGTEGARGVLEVNRVIKGAGNGSIEFDGGMLRARYVEEDFLSNFATGEVKLMSGGGTIDTNGREVHVQPGLTGTGGFRKEGQGTLVLNGTNSYGGPTEVLAGRLVVNGSMTSDIGVSGGAALGGGGSFAGNVTISAGAAIAPGNSPGTMTFTGDLTLDAAAVYQWELGSLGTQAGVDSDLLSISGSGKTMTFESGSLLDIRFTGAFIGPDGPEGADSGFWLVDHDWVIASASGGAALVDEGLTLADPLPYQGGHFTIHQNGNDLILRFNAVPEPSAPLLSLAGAGLFLRRRKPAH